MAFTTLTKTDLENIVNRLFDKLEEKVPALLVPAEETIRAKAVKCVDDLAVDLGIVDA